MKIRTRPTTMRALSGMGDGLNGVSRPDLRRIERDEAPRPPKLTREEIVARVTDALASERGALECRDREGGGDFAGVCGEGAEGDRPDGRASRARGSAGERGGAEGVVMLSRDFESSAKRGEEHPNRQWFHDRSALDSSCAADGVRCGKAGGFGSSRGTVWHCEPARSVSRGERRRACRRSFVDGSLLGEARRCSFQATSAERVKLWSFADLLGLRLIYWLRQEKGDIGDGVSVAASATMPAIRHALAFLSTNGVPLLKDGKSSPCSSIAAATCTSMSRTGPFRQRGKPCCRSSI